jgi:hypothetical protein
MVSSGAPVELWRRLLRASPLAASILASPLTASTCPVPEASHPTIGAALRDATCTTIELAARAFAENIVVTRDVAIAGAGATASIVAGSMEIAGASTDVSLARLAMDGTGASVAGCWPSLLRTTGGARLTANDDVSVTNSGISTGACRLFADGFESAGVLAWSAASP